MICEDVNFWMIGQLKGLTSLALRRREPGLVNGLPVKPIAMLTNLQQLMVNGLFLNASICCLPESLTSLRIEGV
jgi:hypothetical protein